MTPLRGIGTIDKIIAINATGIAVNRILLVATDASSLPNITGAKQLFDIANILWSIQQPNAGPIFECVVKSLTKVSEPFCKGLRFEFPDTLRADDRADAVFLPGFLYRDLNHLLEKMKVTRKTVHWIRKQHDNGAIIGASCSGTLILAETTLLNGREATTSWWLDSLFRTRYPEVRLRTDRLLIDDGRLLTAGAVTSYANLVLRLIEEFAGRNLALSCSKMMLIDINRPYQAPYMMLQTVLNHSDSLVQKAQFWIHENFREDIDIRQLADSLAVSYRTLVRRFKTATGETPLAYIQKTRIDRAKHLFETTDLSMETIMGRVGYSDPSSFSLLFKRLTRLSPKKYRQQFSMLQVNDTL